MRTFRRKSVREKDIEKSILEWLNYQPGVYAFKVNTTGIFDPSKGVYRTVKNKYIALGCADIIGVLPAGIFLAIEVKTPTTIKRYLNSPTPSDLRQRQFITLVRLKMGVAMCVSSLDEVIEALKPWIK